MVSEKGEFGREPRGPPTTIPGSTAKEVRKDATKPCAVSRGICSDSIGPRTDSIEACSDEIKVRKGEIGVRKVEACLRKDDACVRTAGRKVGIIEIGAC
jgi:hypothetical protein